MNPGQNIAEYAVSNLTNGLTIAAHVRVAGTSKDRRTGLLGIDCLPAGSGLWIAPCEAIHTFGMKIAIDVLFLDRKFRVKKLLPNLPPRRISVCLSASSVLELEAGAIGRSGTQVGHFLSFLKVSTLEAQRSPMGATRQVGNSLVLRVAHQAHSRFVGLCAIYVKRTAGLWRCARFMATGDSFARVP